jgi:thiol-disulfide isomerase/thioredoxin
MLRLHVTKQLKMKKLLLASALVLAMPSVKAQLALQNFNGAGLPAGWSMLNEDKRVINSDYLHPTVVSGLTTNAWMKTNMSATDSIMMTTSLFKPAGQADRWLITPSFNVNNVNTFISWHDHQLARLATAVDEIEIWVSTTGGATKADFTTKLATVSPASAKTKRMVSLSAYNGQNVKIGFRCIGMNGGLVGLDDIASEVTTPTIDASLSAMTPVNGTFGSFGSPGSTAAVSVTVNILGNTPVSSYKINYQLGSGTVVSETKTLPVPSFGRFTNSFTTPAIFPTGTQELKVWVEATGDVTHTNDTLKVNLNGYTTKPTKKVFVEEGTGTWCGFCPRGTVFMDSVQHKYRSTVDVVAVHNADDMEISAYDSYFSSMYGTGRPGMVVDRAYGNDPDQVFSVYDVAINNFGFANMDISTNLTGSTLSGKVKVTPTITLADQDFRVALVLIEDRVSGTGARWNQSNYYAKGQRAQGTIMKNAEYDFNNLPASVPASIMKYDFVARANHPNVTGNKGSLPANMTAGTTYDFDFSGVSINSSWNKDKMRVIALLINGTSGQVFNTVSAPLTPVSISEVNAKVSNFKVYPNPVISNINVDFYLEEGSKVNIDIVDIQGRVVKNISSEELTAGSYSVASSVDELANGVYLVRVATATGSTVERINISK